MLKPAEGKLFALRYRLKKRIGGRGLGEVWEALDEKLERRVAIKIIQPRFARDPRRVEQFERGAKSVAKLRSPHVVQLLDYGVHNRPFMVLELMDGLVLRDVLDEGVKFPLETAVSIAVQTAKALTAAHEQDIVHRKLEPGNIFLSGAGEDVFVKVFDFGTAKWLTDFQGAEQITTMGAILGSPDYVAPEQISGDERSDLRADIWSLAAITYHLICGRPPFAGDGIGDVIRKVLNEPHTPPSEIHPELPPDLDAFFEQALSKDRDHRFHSAVAFSQALCDVTNVELGPVQRRRAPEASSGDAGGVVAAPILDIGELAKEDRELFEDAAPISSRAAEGEAPAIADPNSTEAALAALDRASPAMGSVEPALPSTLSVELPRTKAGKGWLLVGAALALVLGGYGAYRMLGSMRNGDTRPAPSADTTTSADPANTTDDTNTTGDPNTTDGTNTTGDTNATGESSATSAASAPPASASASASAAPSAAPKVIPRPRPRWPDDDDIYE